MRRLCLIAVMAFAPCVHAGSNDASGPRSAGIDQNLNAAVPLDLVFRDDADRPVKIGDYVAGKPVILVPVYYRCPMLCNLVLNGLTDALSALKLTAGDDFQVVVFSFDPKENPALAAAKKSAYVKQYARPGADKGWHFLTGEPDAITRLTGSLGYRYYFDEKTREFAHPSGIMVLTPEGRISRYFYLGTETGRDFSARDLRLGLVEASGNQIGTAVDQVLLLCFGYDPATGKYSASVMKIVRVAGAVSVGLLLAFIGVMFWKDARRRKGMSSVRRRRYVT